MILLNRYIITDRSADDDYFAVFPNIKVEIIQERNAPDAEQIVQDTTREWTCSLDIHKDVNVETLSTLLRIPLRWRTLEGTLWRGAPTDCEYVVVQPGVDVLRSVHQKQQPISIGEWYKRSNLLVLLESNPEPERFRSTVSALLWLTLSVCSMQRARQNPRSPEVLPQLRFDTDGGLCAAEMIMETASVLF